MFISINKRQLYEKIICFNLLSGRLYTKNSCEVGKSGRRRRKRGSEGRRR
jgi:hypothetical protein